MSPDPAVRKRFLDHFLVCEGPLRAFVASVTARTADREDLVQEIVIRLWQLYDRYDAAQPFTPWALGVAARRMKEEYRRAARRPHLQEPAVMEQLAAALEAHAEEGGDQAGRAAALSACVEALPENAGLLIRGRYYQRQSIDDLAAAAGQSAAAIYQTLCRVRRRLAECIRRRLRPEPATAPLRHADRS